MCCGFAVCSSLPPSLPSSLSGQVFLPEQQRVLVKVVPVRETHVCEWAWQLPPSTPLYRKAPLSYISHLLGHEGEGCL